MNSLQNKPTPTVRTARETAALRNTRKRGKSSFWRITAVYCAVLAVLMAAALIYVHSLLVKYEASQPDNVVVSEVSRLKAAAENGKLSELMTVYGDSKIEDIAEKLTSAEKLICRKKAGVYESDTVVYTVSDGVDDIAEVTLSAEHSYTKLAIFSFTDWVMSSATPPTVRYRFNLPSSFSMYVDGSKIEADSISGNTASYIIDYDGRNYTFSDIYGTVAKYIPGEVPTAEKITVSLPENFTLQAGDFTANGNMEITERAKALDSEYLAEFGVELPDIVTYEFYLLDGNTPFTITDNLGNSKIHTPQNGRISIASQNGGEHLGEGFIAEADIISAAESWSRFMTQDLSGKTNGFYTLEPLLINDSYLYNAAWQWATGVDITFTSVHTLDNPPFSNQTASNYIKYSDTCFSCDVYLEKNMIVARKPLTDTMHATIYWVNTDGVWKMADIIDLPTEEAAYE